MTPYEYAHYFIYQVLQQPLVGLGKLAGFEVIYQFLSTLLWFFGINGPAVTNTVFSPIHKVLTVENYEAAQAGLEMVNIFTSGFSFNHSAHLGQFSHKRNLRLQTASCIA